MADEQFTVLSGDETTAQVNREALASYYMGENDFSLEPLTSPWREGNEALYAPEVLEALTEVVHESMTTAYQEYNAHQKLYPDRPFSNPNLLRLDTGERIAAHPVPFEAERKELDEFAECPPGVAVIVGGSKVEASVKGVNEDGDKRTIETLGKADPKTYAMHERQVTFEELVDDVCEVIDAAVRDAEQGGLTRAQIKELSISLGHPQAGSLTSYGKDSALVPPFNKGWEIDNCEGRAFGAAVMEVLEQKYNIKLEAIVVDNDTYFPGEDSDSIREKYDEVVQRVAKELEPALVDVPGADPSEKAKSSTFVLDIRGVTGEGANEMAKYIDMLFNLEIGGWQCPDLRAEPLLARAKELGLIEEDEPHKFEMLMSGGYVHKRLAAALSILNERFDGDGDGDFVAREDLDLLVRLIREDTKSTKIMDKLVQGDRDAYITYMRENLQDVQDYDIAVKHFDHMRGVANLIMRQAVEAQALMIASIIQAQSRFESMIHDCTDAVLPHTGSLFFLGDVLYKEENGPYVMMKYGQAALRAAEKLLREKAGFNLRLHAAQCDEQDGGYVAALRQLERVRREAVQAA